MNIYASSEKAGEPCRKGLDVSKAINPRRRIYRRKETLV